MGVTPRTLAGLTALLVEDESLVSMLAEDILADAGCAVVLAMRLGEALDLARSEQLDFAILDVNLGGGQTSYPVADVLAERGIAFLFATGYDAGGLDALYPGVPLMQKPYAAEALVGAAAALLGR